MQSSKDHSDDTRVNMICKWFIENDNKYVPAGYVGRANRAGSIFFYQPVYNPLQKQILNFINPRVDVDCNTLTPLINVIELEQLGYEFDVEEPSTHINDRKQNIEGINKIMLSILENRNIN